MACDLVSIVVPVYNVEKYLQICLNSIINQTYRNLEVILVDDGSTDHSGEICDHFCQIDNRLHVFHKSNEGLGITRNKGLSIASGKFIMFVDSDDFLEPKSVEILISSLKNVNADICKGSFNRVDNNGNLIKKVIYNDNVYAQKAVCNQFLSRFLGSSPNAHDSVEPCVWGTLYKKSIISDYNLSFLSEREFFSEDLLFNFDYLCHSSKGIIISSPIYNYRYNESSLTLSYRQNRLAASKKLYYFITEKINSEKFSSDVKEEMILRSQRRFFISLRTCIAQEKQSVSKHSRKEALASIYQLCNDPLVEEILKKYPIKQIGIKQQVFLTLIKMKCCRLLLLCSECGLA